MGNVGYCLEIEFSQDHGKVTIYQKGYIIDLLKRFNMFDSKPAKTLTDPNVKLTKINES